MEETDLIEQMKCRNCLNYQIENSCCKLTNEPVKVENTCPSWSENINKKNELQTAFLTIKEILKEFIDTKEENIDIIALWIMGTWVHKNFLTYPYLYINAMKGSGKTRTLKLIKELSWQGDMLASLSEAVLFRTTGTLCIDEFEGISGKDKNALRELLNTAYKRGGKVKRMRKVKNLTGEQQVVEEFDTFRPIVMANISGMEEVLQDRCISIILEKSSNSNITRKVEDFQFHPKILEIKGKINFSVGWCMYDGARNVYREWNTYIDTHTYIPSLDTPTYTNLHLFEKIYNTNLDGRNLEISFPLLLLAAEIGIEDRIIEVVKNIVLEKKETDVIEGKDVMLFDFVARQIPNEFYKINELVNLFKIFISYEPEDERHHWLNNTWMGKALTRLNLKAKHKRVGQGIEVMLNVDKAKEKLDIFK